MIRCNICGRIFDSGNALKDQQGAHCHLLRVHYSEYKAVRFSRAALTESSGAVYQGSEDQGKKAQGKAQEKKVVRRPSGFRPLDRSFPEEAAAYDEGFRYIDDEDYVYDRAEAREKGWI